ncbi:MAG: hypothetical protein QT10_C0014G0028 [archaeon GW2011_AR19]|nr:MAG: hypothetical protein QT10_C0014G0028 [archaeon GW2011_AR19]
MKTQTKNPLEILLDCRIATSEEKRKKFKEKIIPNTGVLWVGNEAYLIEEPEGNLDRYSKPIAYSLGKSI